MLSASANQTSVPASLSLCSQPPAPPRLSGLALFSLLLSSVRAPPMAFGSSTNVARRLVQDPNTESGRECMDQQDNDGDGKADC